MIIRKYKKGDLDQCLSLIRRVQKEFLAPHTTKKASLEYDQYHDVQLHPELPKTFDEDRLVLVALEASRVVGVARGKRRNIEKISQLFVDGKFQRRGIGSQLMDRFELAAKKGGARILLLNADPYAVAFYEKIGYRKTTGLKKKRSGLVIQPMKKIL